MRIPAAGRFSVFRPLARAELFAVARFSFRWLAPAELLAVPRFGEPVAVAAGQPPPGGPVARARGAGR